MPSALTYPGVYVEEISSGVRTITGVATSITAFVGRARMGPVNEATTINSFGDFERTFGGLWAKSSVGFAVRDFYLNGGSKAVIVRLVGKQSETATLKLDTLELEAASPGDWGKSLRGRIDYDVPQDGVSFPPALKAAGLKSADLFNLTLRDMTTGVSEVFKNVSVITGAKDVKKVLENESALVVVKTKGNARPEENDKGLSDDDKKIAPFSADDVKEGNTKPRTTAATGGKDGDDLTKDELLPANGEADRKGLFALEQLFANDGIFNLLCIPPYLAYESAPEAAGIDTDVSSNAINYCERRRAMFIVDAPPTWKNKKDALDKVKDLDKSRNAAVFFPRLKQPNSTLGGQVQSFAPCGAVAGVFARTDSRRGVWKAPAGLEANLIGVPELSVGLTDDQNGELNPKGINCLRAFPTGGRVVWGSRTLRGDDGLADEYKYIPVRRTALFIEESLYRGTQWVVFEPNDEPLWSQIRLNVGAFMNNLFRQGAFQGKTSSEAYFVKCDKETTTQNDIDLGIVNIHVGFAPLKPAEFVVLQIQQIAGSIDV